MIQTFENIFRIGELRKKLLITLGFLLIYRIGVHIPLPGIDLSQLHKIFSSGSSFADFVNMFSGGAFKRLSIMALGIMPYISASIILQLLTVVIPSLEKLSKEGEEGRKKITQYTRIGTVILCSFQSMGLAIWLLNQPVDIVTVDSSIGFILLTMITMTTGTTFLMWLGEKITEYGIGNGISLIIMAGIIARFPSALSLLYSKFNDGEIGIFGVLFLFLCMFGVIYSIAFMTQSQRKIPIQHAKRIVGRRVYTSQTSYLPIRLTTAGVIPIIFASSLLMFPYTIGGLLGKGDANSIFSKLGNILSPNSNYSLYQMIDLFLTWLSMKFQGLGFLLTIWHANVFYIFKGFNLYNLLYAILTIVFCFFYTAIIFNPQDIADNLKKYGAFIPGIRPGKYTAQYLDYVLNRITFAGAIFLAVVAIIPRIGSIAFNLPYRVTSFLGGTGMLIVVGVGLDLIQQIESHLYMHNYEGFTKRKIRGRR